MAFYSTNGGIRAAVSERPDGPFEADPTFKISVTEAWEKDGGEKQSLESNGAHDLIAEDDGSVTLWEGYDSYHVDKTTGQLGWAKVRIDRAARTVQLMEKDPSSPLPLLPEGYIAARSGGNLATSNRAGGKYVFLYYTRPNQSKISLTVAVSSDPLFHTVDDIVELEPPLDNEKVIEKFESFTFKGELYVLYENQLLSGHWGTGLRIYKVGS